MAKSSKDRYWEVLNPSLKRLGQKIETLRIKKGFETKEGFANECGISIYYYYRTIKGTANISLLQLMKMCKVLGVKARDLIDF